MRLTALIGITITCLFAVGMLHAAAIHNAIREGNAGGVQAALLQKEDIENNATPLFLAVDLGDAAIVKLLIDNKVSVNKTMDANKDYPGWTALHLAASRDNGIIVDLLLKAGAQKDILTSQGERAAQLASDALVKNKLE